MIKDAVYLCIMHPDSVLILNTVGNVDVPSFLSCSALSMSSGDGNVLGNVTISFCKQEFVIYYIIYWIKLKKSRYVLNVVTLRRELRKISLSGWGVARWQSLELILNVVSRHCIATVKRRIMFSVLHKIVFLEIKFIITVRSKWVFKKLLSRDHNSEIVGVSFFFFNNGHLYITKDDIYENDQI